MRSSLAREKTSITYHTENRHKYIRSRLCRLLHSHESDLRVGYWTTHNNRKRFRSSGLLLEWKLELLSGSVEGEEKVGAVAGADGAGTDRAGFEPDEIDRKLLLGLDLVAFGTEPDGVGSAVGELIELAPDGFDGVAAAGADLGLDLDDPGESFPADVAGSLEGICLSDGECRGRSWCRRLGPGGLGQGGATLHRRDDVGKGRSGGAHFSPLQLQQVALKATSRFSLEQRVCAP